MDLVKSLQAKYDIKEKQAIDVMMDKEKLLEKDENYDPLAATSIDPFEFLQLIQRVTGNELRVDDFFAASMASVLEPLLETMNYGKFSLRTSPFCGFVACLLNTEKYGSVPFNRIFNYEKFYNEMTPLLPKLKGASAIGSFFLASQVKKILQSCALQPGIPDLFSYLIDKGKAEDTRHFIQNLQFIVVHNNMDLGAVDIVRRCKCSAITSSKATPNGIAAQCTGCI